MAPTRNHKNGSAPRRTIKHVDTLGKGLACIPCQRRRVRCSGEHPACAACLRNARWKGRDLKTNHGRCYSEPKEDEEQDDQERGELTAAKLRILQLERRLANLEEDYPDRRPPTASSNGSSNSSATNSPPYPSVLATSDILPLDYFPDYLFDSPAGEPFTSTPPSQLTLPSHKFPTFPLFPTLPDPSTLPRSTPLSQHNVNVSYSDFTLPPPFEPFSTTSYSSSQPRQRREPLQAYQTVPPPRHWTQQEVYRS